ncbi:MAG: Fe-S cluster assembly protein SufD [Lactovum sp.]
MKEEILEFSKQHAEPEWLSNLRQEAYKKVEELSLPEIEGANFKTWKLETTVIGNNSFLETVPDFTALGDNPLFISVGSNKLLEQLSPELVEKGVIFTDFQSALEEVPEIMEKYLGTVLKYDDHKLAAANMASFNSGMLLYVPDNVEIEGAIEAQILHDSNSYIPFNKRLLIIAGKHSKFSYLEQVKSTEEGTDKTTGNLVVEILALEGAQINYSTVDQLNEHLTTYISRQALLEKNASIEWSAALMNDGNIIYDLDSSLKGEASSSKIRIVGLSSQRQIQIVDTSVINYGNHSVGHILQHGVILDKARLSFNGIGHIIKGAKGADAQQESRVLMLSDKARSDANPILLIDENEVTAGHAASIGQIEEEDLYYLMSRGLDEKTAKRLIIRGFLSAVVSEIPSESLRAEFIETIDRKLDF